LLPLSVKSYKALTTS